jgi:PAT family beta-lactamase induction signal transducer AmpG
VGCSRTRLLLEAVLQTSKSRLPPVWLMGFINAPLGIFGAVALITLPQLLAANGVPEERIAAITAIILTPGFASFIMAPLLDWRFSRRFYAVVLAVMTAGLLTASLLALRDLVLLTVLAFCGMWTTQLYVAAVGGWLGTIVPAEDKAKVGAWCAVANTAAGGVTAIFAITVLRGLPFWLGAALLGLLILSPLAVFPWLPVKPADLKLASESFRDFIRDVLALLKQPAVLLALMLFCAPCASFALTNALGGLGKDYGASERMVGLVGGAGVTVAGIFGSLIVPWIARRLPPRPLYLAIGAVGALFTLALIVMPRPPTVFALAMLGENIFQAAAFSVEYIVILRGISQDNPLAATQYGLLTAATTVPIAYMQALDGIGYGKAGILGSYLTDAMLSFAACVLLGLVLGYIRRRVRARAAA